MNERPGLPIGRFIAEFGVIVLGVLVALFTESAWEERGERAEEAEVLARIGEELRGDSTRLSTAGLWLDFVIPAAQRVPDILAGRDTLPPEGQLAILYAAATVNTGGSLFWTWDELRETGRTGLIRDSQLRSALLRYFGASEEFELERSELPDTYRAVTVGLLPAEYTNRVLNRCLRATGTADSAPVANASASLEACRESPGVPAETLLDAFRARDGIEVEAGRLAYELTQVRGRQGLLVAQYDSVMAALERWEGR